MLLFLRFTSKIEKIPRRTFLSTSNKDIKPVGVPKVKRHQSPLSSNSMDVIQIEKKPVAVRFMEMNLLDVFREFNKRNPGLVERSTFHSLRP
jgi:hypothetical protein